MKTILCYGDSNTWGCRPADKQRYEHGERWTRRLQALLGERFSVVEEGQNGRTTVHDDPVEGFKNGMTYLFPCLESHKPVDLVVMMLGTNDLKQRFAKTPGDIARSTGRLVRAIQTSEFGPDGGPPQVLLIAPPPLGKLTELADMFAGGTEKSRWLGEAYRQIAVERGCHFLDGGAVVRSSDIDGVHLDADQLPLLAAAVAAEISALFG